VSDEFAGNHLVQKEVMDLINEDYVKRTEVADSLQSIQDVIDTLALTVWRLNKLIKKEKINSDLL